MTPVQQWPVLDLDARPGTTLEGLDDRVALFLDDREVVAVEHDAAGHWRAFFQTDEACRRAATAAAIELPDVVDVSTTTVEDEGWAVKVQQALGAVDVGNLVIAPPWDVPETDRIVVQIEPSMGFGTGHHQSTRLCLQLLQQVALRGTAVIDAGTGSGVLAIAACLLGATAATAFDYDPDAVEAARDNARRNGVAGCLQVEVVDLAAWSAGRTAPVVCANLTAFLLRRFAGALSSMVAPGGRLLLAGFTADQVGLVLDAFREFSVTTRLDEDDWVGLALER